MRAVHRFQLRTGGRLPHHHALRLRTCACACASTIAACRCRRSSAADSASCSRRNHNSTRAWELVELCCAACCAERWALRTYLGGRPASCCLSVNSVRRGGYRVSVVF
eukprot:900566-Prymnesium_polylepis.1